MVEETRWSEFHRSVHRLPIVACAAVVREGRVLLVRQTYGRLRGQWALPGGFVDPGETPAHAAVREVREEAAVAVEARGLVAVTGEDWEGDCLLAVVFLCRHVGGEPVAAGSGNDRAAFLSLGDMDGLGEPLEPLSARVARAVLGDGAKGLAPVDVAGLQPACRLAYL